MVLFFKLYSARAARAFPLAQTSTKGNKMPFFFGREKRLLFLEVCFSEKLCLSIRLYLSATFPQGATVSGRKTVGYAVLYRYVVLGFVEGRLCFYFQVGGRGAAASRTCACEAVHRSNVWPATHLENAPTASGIFAARRRPTAHINPIRPTSPLCLP